MVLEKRGRHRIEGILWVFIKGGLLIGPICTNEIKPAACPVKNPETKKPLRDPTLSTRSKARAQRTSAGLSEARRETQRHSVSPCRWGQTCIACWLQKGHNSGGAIGIFAGFAKRNTQLSNAANEGRGRTHTRGAGGAGAVFASQGEQTWSIGPSFIPGSAFLPSSKRCSKRGFSLWQSLCVRVRTRRQ